MEVSSDEDICKAIITITFSCQQTIIKHKKAKKYISPGLNLNLKSNYLPTE